MRAVSKSQIETARQINVLEYFQAHIPQELIKISAHDFRTQTHSSLENRQVGAFQQSLPYVRGHQYRPHTQTAQLGM